jgi:hypothetical protein
MEILLSSDSSKSLPQCARNCLELMWIDRNRLEDNISQCTWISLSCIYLTEKFEYGQVVCHLKYCFCTYMVKLSAQNRPSILEKMYIVWISGLPLFLAVTVSWLHIWMKLWCAWIITSLKQTFNCFKFRQM